MLGAFLKSKSTKAHFFKIKKHQSTLQAPFLLKFPLTCPNSPNLPEKNKKT